MTQTYEDAMAEAFPAVNAGIQPFGSRVLVQIRTPKRKSSGGIIIENGESALFVIFNDLDILGKVDGDPLAIRAFI